MAKKSPAQSNTVITDGLDTLLHTIRCIAQHEDALCTLLHEARNKGKLSASAERDLRALLADIPAEEYAWQLHAIERELDRTASKAAA